VVATAQVYLRELASPSKTVNHIRYPQNGKPILDVDLIDGSTIVTHPPRSVLFRGKEEGLHKDSCYDK